MSAALDYRSNGFTIDLPPSDSTLVRAVDQVQETQGIGVTVIANGIARTLRSAPRGDSTIVFEYRPSPLIQGSLPVTRSRTGQTSPGQEWLTLGLNCGGAALAWVGVVGTGAAAPFTGGQSLWGTALLWGGALAASGACSVSVFRTGAMMTGHAAINQDLDNNGTYLWTMRGLDVVGLLGVGGAVKDIMVTRDALEASGLGWRRAITDEISRPQRKVITESLDLVGSKRVSAKVIGAIVKQRLLAAIAAGIGVGGSAAFGSTHDLVVWIMTRQQGQ